MKYKDILEDVLAGKLVKSTKTARWFKMNQGGSFEYEDGSRANIARHTFKFDTWEVKPDESEEIYVWGWTKPSSDMFYETLISTDGDFSDKDGLIIESEKPFMPLGRPKKYKLIPVEKEKEHFYEHLKPREYTGTTVLVQNAMGGESKITLSVSGGIRETCGSKFKLIPVDEEVVSDKQLYTFKVPRMIPQDIVEMSLSLMNYEENDSKFSANAIRNIEEEYSTRFKREMKIPESWKVKVP